MSTLYNVNKNPKKSIKNTGFKDKEKALETIKIVKKYLKSDKIKQMQIILTMYYRAEHHPYKTKDMEQAQKVFKKWLIENGYKSAVKKN
jgi:hypothetical protein